MNMRNVGNISEEYVVDILIQKGYQILERNYSTKLGEIDIIALKERCVHFIEVKARSGHEFGYPAEAVGQRKQERIRRVAQIFLSNRRMSGFEVSFDVAELELNIIENCF